MHATSTPAGDRLECRAVRNVFGKHADELKVSSTKSVTGHLLGAAGALETIATVLAGNTGVIPPTINIVRQDSECDLNVTPNVAGRFDAEYLMNNSIGFGGTNACLVLKAGRA
jgi:3-oxoacyl-[acyl-carrier-protein] synthase II